MATAPPADRARRNFRIAVAVWFVGLATSVSLLTLPSSSSVRETSAGVALVAAGLIGTACGAWRATQTRGVRSRAWSLLAIAGLIVVVGNAWAATRGAEALSAPSLVSDVAVGLGYLLSIPALLAFAELRRPGTELMIVLDGLVAGAALLLIVSVIVYPRLLEGTQRDSTASQILALITPGLDVVMGTVAVLLLIRASREDGLVLGLVATGFLLYAAADLVYAAQVVDGTFDFGGTLSLGWIIGYLTLALASWAPSSQTRRPGQGDALTTLSDVPGTALVFSLVVAAAVVQVVSGDIAAMAGVQSVVWVVLIAAAGTRQVLLIRANQRLRRGLERQVLEQTADLRSLARRHETLVRSVAEGVYGVDQEGRITFANPSVVSILGFPLDQLIGARAHDLFHSPGPDGRPFGWTGCYEHEAITRGVLARSEADDYVRADGSTIPVEITASPMVDDDVVRGAVVVFRDVTQRREVDRMKDEFLSVVSHELRTPLTSIRGSLGLLAGGHLGAFPPAADQLVSVARQSTERLVRLVDDLLSLEKAGAGAVPLSPTHLDARDLLVSVAHQIDGLAGPAGVEVVVDPGAGGSFRADEDKMLQVLLNLTSNAIKFSDPGSQVRLDARSEGEHLHLAIEDSGRGIPEDKLESVFTRFEQVDSSDSRQKGGAGLGLTISRAIVEQHGGRIWVTSLVGRGTTAHVTIPTTSDPRVDPARTGAESAELDRTGSRTPAPA